MFAMWASMLIALPWWRHGPNQDIAVLVHNPPDHAASSSWKACA
jgi:hypothetical protein